MKKHALILIIAALVAASCVENITIVPDVLKEDVPIDFSWYASRSQSTKADPDYYVGGATLGEERHLKSGTSMGVFGYFHPQSSGTAGTWQHGTGVYNAPNLFYNEPVSVTENGGIYTYDYANSRFWPKNKLDRISFIAYYPWNELNTSGSASSSAIVEPFLDKNSEREGMVGFYYTVKQKAEDQVDFMVSDLCLDQSKAVWTDDNSKGLTGTANGKVKFFFHHALSQVRVRKVEFDKGNNEDVELKINYIVFDNVAVFGQCIPEVDFSSTNATGRTTVTPTWPAGSLAPARGDGTHGVMADVCYSDPNDDSTLITDNILLMIPHTFITGANAAFIEVNFDVTRWKDINDKGYLADGVTPDPEKYYYRYAGNNLKAPLTTTSISGWEAGKIYTYNIHLDLKQIKVTADVIKWLEGGDEVDMEN